MTTQPTGASAATRNGAATQPGDGSQGRWAVVVSSLAVLATAAACLVFFSGYLGIARLPGPIPPMDQIPRTPASADALREMAIGLGLFALAGVLALVGLVGGIVLWRRPDGYRSGAWAMALAACTPVLTIMMLAGMGAT